MLLSSLLNLSHDCTIAVPLDGTERACAVRGQRAMRYIALGGNGCMMLRAADALAHQRVLHIGDATLGFIACS